MDWFVWYSLRFTLSPLPCTSSQFGHIFRLFGAFFTYPDNPRTATFWIIMQQDKNLKTSQILTTSPKVVITDTDKSSTPNFVNKSSAFQVLSQKLTLTQPHSFKNWLAVVGISRQATNIYAFVCLNRMLTECQWWCSCSYGNHAHASI